MRSYQDIFIAREAERRFTSSPEVDRLIGELGKQTHDFWEPGARALISSYLAGQEDITREYGFSSIPRTHVVPLGGQKGSMRVAAFNRNTPDQTYINTHILARESREIRHATQGPYRDVNGGSMFVTPQDIYRKSGREEAYHRMQHYGWHGTLPMDGHSKDEIERDAKQAAGWPQAPRIHHARDETFESYLAGAEAHASPYDALDMGASDFSGDGVLW